MKTATNNPHKWLFAYLSSSAMQGYCFENNDEARKALVFDYSDGNTESLSELYQKYPLKYQQMRHDLSTRKIKKNQPLDIARKRVIASLFSYLRFIGYSPDMDYVKKVAQTAGKAKSFNSIPLSKLKQLYRIFGEMHKKKSTDWSDEVLNKIAESVI